METGKQTGRGEASRDLLALRAQAAPKRKREEKAGCGVAQNWLSVGIGAGAVWRGLWTEAAMVQRRGLTSGPESSSQGDYDESRMSDEDKEIKNSNWLGRRNPTPGLSLYA